MILMNILRSYGIPEPGDAIIVVYDEQEVSPIPSSFDLYEYDDYWEMIHWVIEIFSSQGRLLVYDDTGCFEYEYTNIQQFISAIHLNTINSQEAKIIEQCLPDLAKGHIDLYSCVRWNYFK